MAGQLLGSPGASRKGRRVADGALPMSEINVTPFVDVMLVLLIIFMVAAPMMTVNVPLQTPAVGEGAKMESEAVTVSVQIDGRIYVNDTEVTEQSLVAAVRERSKNAESAEQRIYIRGDKGVVYDKMVGIVSALSQAGYDKIGLVSNLSKP